MPSEPDNKMDDLLKAYAKKRRNEAGDPLEMHPATRRLLQAEAAKLRPKAPERSGSSWFGTLLAFWPRYAFAAGLFVVLGLVTWTFFQFGEHPQQMALLDTEQNGARPEPPSPQESAEKMAAPAAVPAVSEFKKESEVRQLTGRELDSLALREEAGVRLKSVADESKAKKNIAEFAANESLQKMPEANRPAPTPPASAPVLAPTPRAEKPAVRQLAAVDAQDKRKLTESGDAAQAAGKNVALNYAQTPNQPLVTGENTLASLNRDLSLSDSSTAKPQLDALSTANAVTLQLADSPGAYNEGIAPLGNSRAQELFGLTNNSAGARFGQNQTLTANSAQAPFDNYSKLPGLQANSPGADAQNSQFFRAGEAETLARLNSRAPAPQSPPPAAIVSEPGIAAAGPMSRQTPVATGAGRFYSQAGTAAQTGQSGTRSRSRFSQVQSTDGQAMTLQRAGVAGTQVLTEFDFEQTGDRVRVVDADGSVYDGQILEAPKVDFDDGTKDRARRDAVTTTPLRQAPSQSSPTEGADAGAPAWNFRASGTNRTLQQPVTINGVLYGVSSNRAGQAAPTRGLQRQTQQATQQSANTAQQPVQRIKGRVQVGAGAETQLDAVRRGN